MMSRVRRIAALLALTTLSLTVAEGAWASTCVPGMAMDTAPGAMASIHGMEMPAAGVSHAESSGTHSGSPTMPSCPLASVVGSCIALALSLPAHTLNSFVPAPVGMHLVPSPYDAPSLLLSSAFFRPPRA